jgi:hypothetical protein
MLKLMGMFAAAAVACGTCWGSTETKPMKEPEQIARALEAQRMSLPAENTGMTAVVRGLSDVTPKTRVVGRMQELVRRSPGTDGEFCEALQKR